MPLSICIIDENKDGSLAWRHLAKADKGRRGDRRPNVGPRRVTLTLEADKRLLARGNRPPAETGRVVVTKDRRFYNFRHLNDAANDYELDSKDELAVAAASGNWLLPLSETYVNRFF
ncbi:hypothetical protein CDAR_471241 [Caerostris darwini]|uniref:Uncharacterized protein n=1 Tax=Caerostris darwini TaxID=1538125 RepID=A0AAV4QLU1_9ARAC|nr:hypothetical protein CDAR_471241 [Caerostris darwini]